MVVGGGCRLWLLIIDADMIDGAVFDARLDTSLFSILFYVLN
jgi:hypothetical protein